jgi:hypothetical protein
VYTCVVESVHLDKVVSVGEDAVDFSTVVSEYLTGVVSPEDVLVKLCVVESVCDDTVVSLGSVSV